MFGGTYSLSGTAYANQELWALPVSGAAQFWAMPAVQGTPPPARVFHSMVYDPVRDRMLVFGGYDTATYFNDVWALSLSEPMTWTQLTPSGTPPAGRYAQVAGYDPVNDRMFTINSNGANQAIRLISNVSGTQTVQTQMNQTAWLVFGKSNNLSFSGGGAFPGGILLNPKPIPAPKPQREKRKAQKNDPKLVAAARELRDRWLEKVNSGGADGGAELISDGKYDITRQIESSQQRLLPAA